MALKKTNEKNAAALLAPSTDMDDLNPALWLRSWWRNLTTKINTDHFKGRSDARKRSEKEGGYFFISPCASKVIGSSCIEAVKKKKKPPGNQKLGSTTKTSCFLSLAESFHVTGLLLSFVKADDRFFFFWQRCKWLLFSKLGCVCYYLQYIVISFFTLQCYLKTFIPNKHSHTEPCVLTETSLTSCLNAKVDLALWRMGDGVAAKLHIRAGKREKWENEAEVCEHSQSSA